MGRWIPWIFLVGAGCSLFALGCRPRLPFFPTPSPEFLNFSSELKEAHKSGDPRRVQAVLDPWVKAHPPSSEEGDLYASLLTVFTFPPYPPSLEVSRVFVDRFPHHGEAWRGRAYLLLEALDQAKLPLAYELWQKSLSNDPAIPYETRSSLGLRVAWSLIAQGEVTEGVILALQIPPASPSPFFWQYLIRLAEGCCDPLTFPENPLTPFFQLRAYLKKGIPADLLSLKDQILREVERLGLEPSWMVDLSLYPQELPLKPHWVYLLSRDPALYPLTFRELTLLLCGSPEGREWTVVEGKRGVASLRDALFELHGNARVLGFIPEDQLLPLSTLLSLRSSYLFPLNPLSQLPPGLENVLVLGISAGEQGEELARELLKFSPRALALLLPDSPYGEEFLESFSRLWLREGGWFTAVIFYPPTEVDFTPYMDELSGRSVTTPRESWKDQPPPVQIDFEALVVVGPAPALTRIPSQLLYHDLVSIPVVGDISWQHPQILEAGSALAGVTFLGYLPPKEGKDSSPLGLCLPPLSPPLPLDLVSWDGLQLFEFERQGGNLYDARFPGVSGEILVGRNRTLSRRYSFWTFTRKGIEPLKKEGSLPLFHPELATTPSLE